MSETRATIELRERLAGVDAEVKRMKSIPSSDEQFARNIASITASLDAKDTEIAILKGALTTIARRTSPMFGHGDMSGYEAAEIARAAIAKATGAA